MLSIFKRWSAKTAERNWWTETFTPDERAEIEEAYVPLGGGTAEDLALSDDPSLLGNLAGHLKKEHLRHLGYKLLEHADTLVHDAVPVLSLHFYFAARGDFFYRWREVDDFALEEAAESYRRQIGLASDALEAFRDGSWGGQIPAHAGYRQLRILEEKRGNLELARALCEQAKREGWADDWDKHIARIDKKLAKSPARPLDLAADPEGYAPEQEERHRGR
jgi:hypothetical protein